jgi:hypothetical protein
VRQFSVVDETSPLLSKFISPMDSFMAQQNTKAHCNTCIGLTNHEVLNSESTSWEEDQLSGSDTYATLRCAGCNSIKLRHTSWFSENDEPTVNYFPAAIFRRKPLWFNDLFLDLSTEDEFVETLLTEIYVALQHGLPSLAAMGIRSLLEKVMISKTGDRGSFFKNLAEFEKLGYVSQIQRKRLETVLDAGHATIHRVFIPSTDDVITLVDMTEHIVETVYLHESKIAKLKKSIPARPSKS